MVPFQPAFTDRQYMGPAKPAMAPASSTTSLNAPFPAMAKR